MLGSVSTVTGSQMTVVLEGAGVDENAMRIGAMVKSHARDRDVFGTVAAVQLENGGSPRHVLVVDLIGEVFHR